MTEGTTNFTAGRSLPSQLIIYNGTENTRRLRRQLCRLERAGQSEHKELVSDTELFGNHVNIALRAGCRPAVVCPSGEEHLLRDLRVGNGIEVAEAVAVEPVNDTRLACYYDQVRVGPALPRDRYRPT